MRYIHASEPAVFGKGAILGKAAPMINLDGFRGGIEFLDREQLPRELVVMNLRNVVEICRDMAQHSLPWKGKDLRCIASRRIQIQIEGHKSQRRILSSDKFRHGLSNLTQDQVGATAEPSLEGCWVALG
jgi:hypothetical protein